MKVNWFVHQDNAGHLVKWLADEAAARIERGEEPDVNDVHVRDVVSPRTLDGDRCAYRITEENMRSMRYQWLWLSTP